MALIENLALTMTRAMLTCFLNACVHYDDETQVIVKRDYGSLYFYRFFFRIFIMYITCVLAFGFSTLLAFRFSTARLNAQTNHPQSGKKMH